MQDGQTETLATEPANQDDSGNDDQQPDDDHDDQADDYGNNDSGNDFVPLSYLENPPLSLVKSICIILI